MILKSQTTVVRKAEARFKKKMSRDLTILANDIINRIGKEERIVSTDLVDIVTARMYTNSVSRNTDVRNLYVLGSRYINKAVKGNVDLEKINLLAVKYVKGLKTFNPLLIDGSIAATTVNRIKEIIADGIFDGDSYTEIAKTMEKQKEAGIFSKARAELIAINTIGHAYEEGRKATMDNLKQQGYNIEKYWSTVGDNRVTEQCMNNENQGWLLYNENRPSGDSEAPRNKNIRCRCTTNYRIL